MEPTTQESTRAIHEFRASLLAAPDMAVASVIVKAAQEHLGRVGKLTVGQWVLSPGMFSHLRRLEERSSM